MDDLEAKRRIAEVAYWYHRIEVLPGIVTPGSRDTQALLGMIELPADLSGLRVLDLGARDGFFSFEAERRGAREVVALDYVPPDKTGFQTAKDLRGSKVISVTDSVYNLSPERYGQFDLVLFLGLLYHLRHPLLALDRIWDICSPDALVFIESHVIDDGLVDNNGSFHSLASLNPNLSGFALAQFFPGQILANDPTSQWAPNQTCLRGFLDSAGFDVTHEWLLGSRGGATGRRRGLEPSGQRSLDAASALDLDRGTVIEISPLSPRLE